MTTNPQRAQINETTKTIKHSIYTVAHCKIIDYNSNIIINYNSRRVYFVLFANKRIFSH